MRGGALAAGVVPAVTDHGDTRLGRLGRDALHPADALARQRGDLQGNLGRCRRDRVVLPDLHAYDARGFRRPIPSVKRRAKGDRQFAEDGAGDAPAQRALDPILPARTANSARSSPPS